MLLNTFAEGKCSLRTINETFEKKNLVILIIIIQNNKVKYKIFMVNFIHNYKLNY